MIDHHTWRSLIYRLAEEYPDCLMLNFTIKLISDAGFQSEITSISTAAQQIEVFSRVLKTAITKFLSSPDDVQKCIEECAVCGLIRCIINNRLLIFTFILGSLFRRGWCVMASILTCSAKCLSRYCLRNQKGASI